MHQMIALERRERWRQAAAVARTEGLLSEHDSQQPALRERAWARFAEHRATWADRRARRKRKVGLNPQDAADIAGAAQVRGGFFTTDPGPRP